MKQKISINHFFHFMILISLLPVFLNLSSCTGKKTTPEIVIAEQYGLAYAPLQIIRETGMLEKLVPEADISWVKLGNTAAIREAVLAGKVDAGFLGIPPFLIGRDRGMNWKIISGLSRAPLGLVIDSRKITTMEDLVKDGTIALPQPGSIQHILLSMATGRLFGDPALLDNNLVTLKHPDGMNALISGSVDAHFTSPPFIFQELETIVDGKKPFDLLLSGTEAFGGDFSFIVGMATSSFIEKQPELLAALRDALAEAVAFMNNQPEKAADILAGLYGMESEVLYDYLIREGLVYTTEISGLEGFISFMEEAGYLENHTTPVEVTAE